MKKKTFKPIPNTISVIIISAMFWGCSVQQQVRQAKNLINCDFRILSIENVDLAGVQLQGMSSMQDLNLADAAMIIKAFTAPIFPLNFQLNLEGKNPNATTAGLNKLEYILFLDDVQLTAGRLDKPFLIPANNGIATIPLEVKLDLKQLLSGKSFDALTNFGFNIAGMRNKPSRITAKIKPTILIGKSSLTYPGYITIKTEYSGQ
jgi:hypothetical protein